jgi:hypothetical protein
MLGYSLQQTLHPSTRKIPPHRRRRFMRYPYSPLLPTSLHHPLPLRLSLSRPLSSSLPTTTVAGFLILEPVLTAGSFSPSSSSFPSSGSSPLPTMTGGDRFPPPRARQSPTDQLVLAPATRHTT